MILNTHFFWLMVTGKPRASGDDPTQACTQAITTT